MPKLDFETIQKLPKADLHVHLDGSIRIPTLIEEAQRRNIELPSYTEEGLREKVFKDQYKDLPDYLQGFGLTCAVMQDLEVIERCAYEFAWDSYKDGVLYVEPRYSPDLLKTDKISSEEVILAADKGFKKAQKEINAEIAKENQETNAAKPNFVYSQIICCMRMWEGTTSVDTVSTAIQAKEKHGIPIMAIDLAGPEDGFPPIDHEDAYIMGHKKFLFKTVHAGEAHGPSSIFQALTNLHADRIGHGFHLFNASMINTQDPAKAQRYVDGIVNYIAERRITLEVCLTSNLQTLPQLNGDIKNHTLPKMLDAGLSVAICTDNTLVSNTTVTKELSLAQDAFNLDSAKIKQLVMYGIKRGFYPGNYLEKKAYIDQCAKYYDHLLGQCRNYATV